jgi:hypothetical protein
VLPKLIANLDEATFEELPAVINTSGLLMSQRLRLFKMVVYMYLPEEARTEVAKRLLYDQSQVYQKQIAKTDVLSKIAPMLGLMGTLIPLGPGIVALSAGDTATLSQSLNIAFDSTVAGLVTAAICFVVSRVRRRWYADYLVSLEGALNTLLEKAQLLQNEGYEFPPLTKENFPSYIKQADLEPTGKNWKSKSADNDLRAATISSTATATDRATATATAAATTTGSTGRAGSAGSAGSTVSKISKVSGGIEEPA